MRPALAVIITTSAFLASSPVLAREAEAAPQPAVLKALLDCRPIADPGARLACFDRSAAALDTAAAAKDVLVVDRDTARKTKRGLFGLTLPKLKLFGENDDEEVDQIESKIESSYTGKDGSTVFVLEDGARWKQVEGRPTYARKGDPIHIEKASLGSFFAKIGKSHNARVVRIQ
mgnify:CR=1 FL=1